MSWTVVAALFVALAGRPSVRVDIDALALPHAQAQQLHGELMTRLVEEGHRVGSSGLVTVRLGGGGQDVHVEVQHGRTALTRDVGGEGAVLRLAVIHATLELLAELPELDPGLDPELVPDRGRTVVVEAGAGAHAVVPEVMRALVEGGRVVTNDADDAAWRLCVDTSASGETQVAATGVDEACVPEAVGEDVAAAVGRALTEAESRPPAVETSPRPDAHPASDELATPVEVEPAVLAPGRAPRESAWSGAVGLGVGGQARIVSPEALVFVHGDARHRSGGWLTARVLVAPSVEGAARVADTWITGGGGWSWSPTPRMRIELGAAVGVAVHAFSVLGDTGARADVAVEIPSGITTRVGHRIELGVAPVLGWTSRRRRHRVGDDVIWSRSPWRVGGLALIRVALR